MGRDSGARLLGAQFRVVSIHAPAWGATGSDGQSPLTWSVSIHAPAWGATKKQNEEYYNVYVSIHAPAWGATCNRLSILSK